MMMTWLGPGRLFMDYGPIQATLTAYRDGQPLQNELEAAAAHGTAQLRELASFLPVAKLPPGEIRGLAALPEILLAMIQAVRSCGDPTLTPMAAVAGTFADFMADFLVAQGATKVMVSNGGDIALRLLPGERTRVGIVSDLHTGTCSHTLDVEAADGIGGIATSGFGGRSFSKGIASAAVVLGRTCRIADAAATLVANHTISPDPGITQILAEKLDPETDIAGHWVTASVGSLLPDTREKALENGREKARELFDQQMILGAAIFVGENWAVVPEKMTARFLLRQK